MMHKMERERTLVNLEQGEAPKEDHSLDRTPEHIHANLMSNLSKDITNETLASAKEFCAQSGKLGSTDVDGLGSFNLLWESMQKSDVIAVGKYEIFYEMFKELETPELAGMVREADDEICKIKAESQAQHDTPEPEVTCSLCKYEDEEKITAAEYKCTKCEKNNFLCAGCVPGHSQGLGHGDFIVKLRLGSIETSPENQETPIKDLLQISEEYYANKVFDKAAYLFKLRFPAKPRCHFAYGLTVSRDMGIWRHLVLARCFGELGGPAETLIAFSFDGKCVYINSHGIANNSCHVVPRGEKEFMILRQEEPNVRITDTAGKKIVRDVYTEMPLQRVWTVDSCGKVIYLLHGEGKTNNPTSLVATDMTGKVRATMPTGKQGFVVCDKRRPRVVVLSNTHVRVFDWQNDRLREIKDGEHGLLQFDIWDVCCRDAEILLVGLSTIGEAPWEVVVYQMIIDNGGSWTWRRIQLLRKGEKSTIRSFCSPKLSFCQNRLMLGYKFPIELYRVELYELTLVEKKQN